MKKLSYLRLINEPDSIVSTIDNSIKFPEILDVLKDRYNADIDLFTELAKSSSSSAELLKNIRSGSLNSKTRMSLLKIFRRCVSPVLDTEKTKKIKSVSTDTLVNNYGGSFKDIEVIKRQFTSMSEEVKASLAVLIGEYDTRGYQGYELTGRFFDWFGASFGEQFSIDGPRGAGKDIELSTIFPDFIGSYPCDFVISGRISHEVFAIGFARYDSTRGGAQSDDRTGGNQNKVSKAKEFCSQSGRKFRLIFLSDGPGLTHRDTWEEACLLDECWGENVSVVTLKTAKTQITRDWLEQV